MCIYIYIYIYIYVCVCIFLFIFSFRDLYGKACCNGPSAPSGFGG